MNHENPGQHRDHHNRENQRFDSVWDALESTPEAAQNMTLRCDLMIALEEHIKRNKMSQTQAAVLFGVTQPRVSDLMRGKIDLFSLDSLINMAVAAGMKIELRITAASPHGDGTQKETAAE
jgi:predicted XRE-type DNA-binding protein